MCDDNELSILAQFQKHVTEAAHVGLIKHGIHLIHHTDRRGRNLAQRAYPNNRVNMARNCLSTASKVFENSCRVSSSNSAMTCRRSSSALRRSSTCARM